MKKAFLTISALCFLSISAYEASLPSDKPERGPNTCPNCNYPVQLCKCKR